MDGGHNNPLPVDTHGDKGPWVCEIEPSDEFIGFYVARNPRLDPFRDPTKGKYMRLQLADRSGRVQARIWEEAEQAAQQIADGTPIKIDGLAELYNEELQVQIRRFRPARNGEVRREDMVNTSRRDREQMWLTVQAAIEAGERSQSCGAAPLLLREHLYGRPPAGSSCRACRPSLLHERPARAQL